MKGAAAENALAKRFVGKMKAHISCIGFDHTSLNIFTSSLPTVTAKKAQKSSGISSLT